MIFQLLIVPPLFVILSCSTSSKKDLGFDKEKDAWLQTYTQAFKDLKTNPEAACRNFADLATQSKFVLQDLSLVRAYQACPLSANLPPLSAELTDKSNYLSPLINEMKLGRAEKSGDQLEWAKALRAQALSSNRVHEKIQLLEKALALLQTRAQPEADSELKMDLQNRIYNLAPRLRPEKKREDFQKIAADYIFNREFNLGREYFAKIYDNPESSFDESFQARKSYRNSFKTQQRRSDYTTESEKFAHWLEKQKKAEARSVMEAYLTWARSAWTQGDPAKAREVLNLAEKKLAKKYSLEEVEFIRSRMSEETGDFAEAVTHLEKAEAALRPKSALRDRILFSKAWMQRKLKDYPGAVAALEKLRSETTDTFDQYRYAFWLAKTLQQNGETEKAKQEFLKLREDDNLGYYGLLAYRETGDELPSLLAQENSLNFLKALEPRVAGMIMALLRAGENDVLEKYLQLQTQDLRTAKAANSPTVWLAYLKSYATAGLYLPLFAQIGSLDSSLKTQILKDYPELLFPRKFLEVIDPASQKFGVQAELILSIIRQESAFNPYARSGADAFGLMQVLPSVATDQEKWTGLTVVHHEELYDPAINIPVGASLLRRLQDKYRGNFILTAAAYNANEKAIEGWLRTRLREDTLEFIEDIPYDETRAYVKLVMRNFIFYSRLRNPEKKLAFPGTVLEDLQSFKVSASH